MFFERVKSCGNRFVLFVKFQSMEIIEFDYIKNTPQNDILFYTCYKVQL